MFVSFRDGRFAGERFYYDMASLVPVELRRASDELSHGLQLINGGSVAVAEIEARL